MTYPVTYYSRTKADDVARPMLEREITADIAVIGGGLAGLSAALQMSRAGKKVVVLEAESIGFGASGRNGGFVSPGFATGGDAIAARAGRDVAKTLHKMSIEGVEFVRQNITALKIEEARLSPGIMSVRRYDDGDSLKHYADELYRDYDYKLDFHTTAETRNILNSRRYFQSVTDPNAFHIHPLNYLRALGREIERLGGRIFEHSRVVQLLDHGDGKLVKTAEGQVKAGAVLITTGGYTDGLVGQIKRAYLPIATYVMVSEEAPELIASAIRTTSAIGDNRRAGDYYRVIDGGRRLLWGGRITTRAADTPGVVRELRNEMVGTYPQLASLKTELAWSGLMSYARHLMPQIGQLDRATWYCTAFGGHGLNTTAIGGKVVAEAICGQSDRYKLFEKFGLVWAGGAAGLAAAQLTYWKLQMQDWLAERKAG
ncbi:MULTISPECIES: NAD(P)/FAD-dependent oxidoreductase [Brucella/Ochrobactrum group]|uniref:FAD-binding oxidoreductase n=1 Tax=Brucella pseudintermedia TaxID=370111 RepID=A0ABY5UH96_9HYPH|nr:MULTISPECIES: FAD-binding oxidoreductase [Brucella/Ochrobactrum group]KAB2680979.1 FAD-binding oxidoreductase [Brucella pseudintermedia]MCO7728048.1 FAD-binding oxidoreductase [Brucella intermedia]NKE75252.1 FAD-binding oxidoreductase [Ochrobactrum sp. MC-1LL]UWL62708.1 FAD-binding oxidoreductase [Brucella pseudintermedia]WPM81836.1 FAD-binding oxidoreductase [Brucella pseudintermedia]